MKAMTGCNENTRKVTSTYQLQTDIVNIKVPNDVFLLTGNIIRCNDDTRMKPVFLRTSSGLKPSKFSILGKVINTNE